MKEQQIDWVDEANEASPRSNIFDVKDCYKYSKLLVNALRTPDGTRLESRHQHDYKSYVDVETGCIYFADGGLAYARGTYTADGVEDLRVYNTDDIGLIREHFSWGTFGKNMDKGLHEILLKVMSNEHVIAILETQTLLPAHVYTMFVRELEYRNTNDIYVEDNYGE